MKQISCNGFTGSVPTSLSSSLNQSPGVDWHSAPTTIVAKDESNRGGLRLLRGRPPAFQQPPNQVLATSARIVIVDDDLEASARLVSALANLAPSWIFNCFCLCAGTIGPILSIVPTALLLDVGGSGLQGIELARRVKATFPDLPVVMWSAKLDIVSAFLSVLAEAKGYLIKPIPPQTVLTALTNAIQGKVFLCSKAIELINSLRLRSNAAARLLTKRELQIVGCLLHNLSDKEIQQELGIAYSTVHAHLEAIYRKLGVHCRQEAVSRFLDIGSSHAQVQSIPVFDLFSH